MAMSEKNLLPNSEWWLWSIKFPRRNIVAGSLVRSKATARKQWIRFARRLRIPDDAWEFVGADNG